MPNEENQIVEEVFKFTNKKNTSPKKQAGNIFLSTLTKYFVCYDDNINDDDDGI